MLIGTEGTIRPSTVQSVIGLNSVNVSNVDFGLVSKGHLEANRLVQVELSGN